MLSKVEYAEFVVESAEVAAILRSPREVKWLLIFLHPSGLTVSAFAQVAGLSVNAAFRKVQRYERLGLLKVLRQEARAGRASKVYTCPYHSFFISRKWISVEEQIGEVFEPLRALMIKSMSQIASEGPNSIGGMIMTVTPAGLWMLPANEQGQRWQPQQPGTPAYMHDCGPLFLDYEEAKQLQRELYELFDRYRNKRGGTTYLLHQFLTPVKVSPQEFAFPHAGYTELV